MCVYAYKGYAHAGEYTIHKEKLEFAHEAVTLGEETLSQHQPLPTLSIFSFETSLMELLSAPVPKRYKKTNPLASHFKKS